jgi:hypothetical protein
LIFVTFFWYFGICLTIGIKNGLGGVGIMRGLQDGVTENVVEMECTDAELLLSFTEMHEQRFHRYSHSARVLEFEPLRKTGKIEEFVWRGSDGGPWSPG